MTDLPSLYGSMVFNETVMKKRLPPETFAALEETMREYKALDPALADAVAEAMKEWAVEKGATHYTHWFQPLTGVTAGKHDSFISPVSGGGVIMKFSGKALIQGESDASSFPSGGLRATFEARGYTAWDPTSYAFIKDDTLYIPTAFCTYAGDALDEKAPLLRSMKAVDAAARRVLRLFGVEAKQVYSTTGAEQEYFLIDREAYYKRRDLVYTGRTLFGARPPKGQELDDHYFGSFKLRVMAFTKELDEELWKLGVPAKTEHNEAAPAQHELAPIFEISNVACDHNQLTMEIMRKVAKKHGLTCLLHEKPFEGVNGSGKHNNWGLSTDAGENLLDPGGAPEENLRFLTFFAAVVKAVDEYQDLLRMSIASAGNDHRLGAAEAPPAIVSMFVGEELDAILTSLETGERYDKITADRLEVGADVVPSFMRDTTDRNRTSPFAFTGNKFEFRMPGSCASVAASTTVINTITADALESFADELEGAEDFESALKKLIGHTIHEHKRIIFNGNGYDPKWIEEAARRGLSNYPSAAEAIPHMLDEKNVELMARMGIYTKREIASRCDILLEAYRKNVNIEALTMIEMARRDVMPAALRYESAVAQTVCSKKGAFKELSCRAEEKLLKELSVLTDKLSDKTEELEAAVNGAKTLCADDQAELAMYFRNSVIPAMDSLRETSDRLETLTDAEIWPYPTYGTLLYRV